MYAKPAIQGLYLLTDGVPRGPEQLACYYQPLLAAGVSVLQYRDKGTDHDRRFEEARFLAGLCRQAGVVFIVNDDVALAVECAAAGLHLGREDGSVAVARRQLGESSIIGVSCYDSLERAEALAAEGADYLAFGAVYGSATKPGAARLTLDTLRQARQCFPLPLVAIGGITAANAAPVLAAGVDALAVIQGVHGAPDPVLAARALASAARQADSTRYSD
ncbi:MAG: thiamine phosphate synthase [Ectothiorhodospiraceae bacterium]|nr:thiamine phosphate synthase [Ectothiorhodospiraceae bacterium]